MNTPKKNILLVDISSLIFRAYFALPHMSSSSGQPTNAVYGFINMFWVIKDKMDSDLIIACGDCRERVFRKDIFPQYKAQRQVMPDDFYEQIPFVEEFLSICGVPVLKLPGYEADDVIASLIKRLSSEGKIFIVTSDKDMLQLVNIDVLVCNYQRRDFAIFDKDEVKKKYGIWPSQFVDYLSLIGDKADNIPGIRGIGPKMAAKLLNRFGNLEGILQNIDRLPSRLRTSILENKEQLFVNRTIIKVKDDLKLSLESVPKSNYLDKEKLYNFYNRFEFFSLIKRQFSQKEIKKNRSLSGHRIELQPLKDKFQLKANFSLVFIDRNKIYITIDGERIFFVELDDDNARNFWLSPLNKIVLWAGFNKGCAFPIESFERVVPIDLFLHLSNKILNINLMLEEDSDVVSAIGALFKSLEEIYSTLSSDLLYLLWEIEANVFKVVTYMSRGGMKIDRTCLLELADQLEAELEHVELDIFKLLPYKINLNSPKQLAFMLFEKLRLPVLRKAKTHPSTSEHVLKKLRSFHPVIDKILLYRELNKIMSAYINPLLFLVENNDRIYTKFSLVNTQTGRITAIDPNLQTIPIRSEWGKRIRQAFVSRFDKGYILSSDYSQIELRVLAHLSNEENLISAFRAGGDVHRLTAARLFSKRLDDVTVEERDIAKRVNFGIIYGITPRGLAEDIGISYNSAKAFIDNYFELYPKVKNFIDSTILQAKTSGFVKTMFGRVRYLPEVHSRIKHVREFGYRAAVNTIIQGTAAEIIKLAMISIYDWIINKQSKLILQVHDELIFDVKGNELEELIFEVKTRMEKVINLMVPLKVDIAYGKNWLEAKG